MPFRKDGGVRQQDIEDNKYLATILRTIQTAQLARDEKNLAKATLRERRVLERSIARRRSTPLDGCEVTPTFLFWRRPDISTLR